MPAIALADQQDKVLSLTGTGFQCRQPLTTTTGPNTYDGVKFNGYPAVLQDDPVQPHSKGGCVPDTSVLTTFSTSVLVNGKGVGRIGDKYTSDNTITSGSSNVFVG